MHAVTIMCFDESQWNWVRYRKHIAPASVRTAPSNEVDGLTEGRPSLYYPGVECRDTEETVLRDGVYVQSPKPATIYKVMEFDNHIGASSGGPSKWVKVESTSGFFHGRPISRAEFDRLIKHQIPCCE